MPKRILVVDDEDSIRALVRFVLERVGGWDVLTASSGAAALSVAAEEQPDVILMDVMMPEMDGPATVRHLLANPETRHIPILMMTARHHDQARDEYRHLGARGLIAKPFDPKKLVVDVAQAMGWTEAPTAG